MFGSPSLPFSLHSPPRTSSRFLLLAHPVREGGSPDHSLFLLSPMIYSVGKRRSMSAAVGPARKPDDPKLMLSSIVPPPPFPPPLTPPNGQVGHHGSVHDGDHVPRGSFTT